GLRLSGGARLGGGPAPALGVLRDPRADGGDRPGGGAAALRPGAGGAGHEPEEPERDDEEPDDGEQRAPQLAHSAPPSASWGRPSGGPVPGARTGPVRSRRAWPVRVTGRGRRPAHDAGSGGGRSSQTNAGSG